MTGRLFDWAEHDLSGPATSADRLAEIRSHLDDMIDLAAGLPYAGALIDRWRDDLDEIGFLQAIIQVERP